MELMTLSNTIPGTAGELVQEPWKLGGPVPREILDNDALALALVGGNAQDLALYQVLNDPGSLGSLKGENAMVSNSELDAAAWTPLPLWLASQGVETGAPTSLWCKDGH